MPKRTNPLSRVTAAEQVIDNILRYQRDVSATPSLRDRMSKVPAWYAYSDGGKWLFAPSKYVGYQNNSAATYLKYYNVVGGANGGETEKAISTLGFAVVPASSKIGMRLEADLEAFLARWSKRPRIAHRISVLKSQLVPELADHNDRDFFDRIAIDPEICGGRPTIKGTRVRVSDIVEMMAAGATHEEILEDFPYLAAEDLSAALAYAARAANHRVIRAA